MMSLEAVVGEGERVGSSDEDNDDQGDSGGSGSEDSIFGGMQETETKDGSSERGKDEGREMSGTTAKGSGLGGNSTARAQGGLSWVTRRDKSTTVSGQASTRKPPRSQQKQQDGRQVNQEGGTGDGLEIDSILPPFLTSDDHLNASFETDYGSAWGDITQGNMTPLCNVTPMSSSYDMGSPLSLSSPYSPTSRGGNNHRGGNQRGGKSNRADLSPRDALYYSSDDDDGEGVGGKNGTNGYEHHTHHEIHDKNGEEGEGRGLLGSDDNLSSDDDTSVTSDSVLPEIFFGHRDRDSGQFNAKISFHSTEGNGFGSGVGSGSGVGVVPTHPNDSRTKGGSHVHSTTSHGIGNGVGGNGVGGRGVGVGVGGMPLSDDDINPSHQTIKPPRTGGKGDRLGGGRGKGRGFSLMALVFSPLQHLFHASAIAEGNLNSGRVISRVDKWVN